jgi:uncharacterized protein DUF1905
LSTSLPGEVAEWLKAAVSKTVMGHWPIESSNLSLSAMRKQFRGKVRYFRPDQASGLAVIDIPAAVAKELGGLKQMKVRGALNGVDYTSNVMPAGGGVLALSVGKKLLESAGLKVGENAEVEIERL